MPEEFTLHEETERSDALVAELTGLWERSVRATHGFLADGGVEFYKPYVEEAIKCLPLVMTARADGEPAAFMGITGAHLSVDVNEQNPRALRFYEKHGFQTAGRRETDDCGKPYPILRMELPEEKN